MIHYPRRKHTADLLLFILTPANLVQEECVHNEDSYDRWVTTAAFVSGVSG